MNSVLSNLCWKGSILHISFIVVLCTEGGGYTWMAPSAQSLDISFTMGSLGTPQEPSETQQSSLLFRMPKNPLRRAPRPVEEGFGQATLKSYDSVPTGEYHWLCGLFGCCS